MAGPFSAFSSQDDSITMHSNGGWDRQTNRLHSSRAPKSPTVPIESAHITRSNQSPSPRERDAMNPAFGGRWRSFMALSLSDSLGQPFGRSIGFGCSEPKRLLCRELGLGNTKPMMTIVRWMMMVSELSMRWSRRNCASSNCIIGLPAFPGNDRYSISRLKQCICASIDKQTVPPTLML